MLRVLRSISIIALLLSFIVEGNLLAQQSSDEVVPNPWTGPNADKEKAIENWATKSLSQSDSSTPTSAGLKKLTQPSEPSEEVSLKQKASQAPSELNPFAAKPIESLAGDRYSQADKPSVEPASEPILYNAEDSLNVSLRSESKDSFEEMPSNNPLRTSSSPATNSLRQSSSSDTNSSVLKGNPPSDAARMAFARSGESTPQVPSKTNIKPMPSAPVTKIQMDQPKPQSVAITPINEPRAFAPPVSQPAATPSPERSVLRDTKIASRQPMATPTTTTRPMPSSSAMEIMSVAQGTGQPGDVRLEGPQTPGLRIEKRGPAESRVGQPCRFVISVRNTGTQTAKNVTLRDEVPEGARLHETVPTADQNGTSLAWNLGALHPGEERSVELRVVPEKQGTLGSVATVSFDASASAKTICTKPEIALRLSAPSKVMIGKKQPIKIDVHNPGTGTATGVVLVEEVPEAMRHQGGTSLELEIGTLAPGETRHLDLMLTAEEAGTVVNRLTAIADGNLRVEQSVSFEVVSPALAVSVDGPKRRYLERPASYTVSIDNPGTAPAKDVRIVTQLPSGLKFVRANNLGEYDAATHSVYWSLAELPEGERGAVQVVALPVTAGDHVLQVKGESSEGLKASDTKQLSVEGVVSLAFDIRDRQDPIEVGSDAIYDVVVTNEGTKAASNVRVTIQAPSGMQVVDAQGKVGHQVQGGYVTFAPLTSLAPGEKYPYRIRLQGIQPGDQRVSVSVESDDLAQPIRREESTRVFGDE